MVSMLKMILLSLMLMTAGVSAQAEDLIIDDTTIDDSEECDATEEDVSLAPTLDELKQAIAQELLNKVRDHRDVRDYLNLIQSARVTNITTRRPYYFATVVVTFFDGTSVTVVVQTSTSHWINCTKGQLNGILTDIRTRLQALLDADEW